MVMEISGISRVHQRISDISRRLMMYQKTASSPNVGSPTPANYALPQYPTTASAPSKIEALNKAPQKASFSANLDYWIDKEAKRQNVSPELVKALVNVESGGKVQARSPKGALGLMQLMPSTARMLGVNPRNPQENLTGGIQYLKKMAQRFGDLDLSLAAYNAGPGAVEKYGGVPPYKETRDYIQKIRKHLP